jgi:hypothetical protein
MTAIPSRQRRRLMAAALCGLGAACLLPVGVVFGARSLLGSSGGQNVDSSGALKFLQHQQRCLQLLTMSTT